MHSSASQVQPTPAPGRHPPGARAGLAVAGFALTGALAGCLVLASLMLPASSAAPLTLEGLTFSDELGGVELIEGWGSGTLDDPIVLVEEITELGPATLVVRGMDHRFGNRIRSHHDVGFALTKIVRNATEEPWSLFNLELREFIDHSSPFGDGLSFGQASEAGRPFFADSFPEYVDTGEPYDGVAFYGGVVEPGETVVISVVVTDTTPRWEFFLLQKRDSPLADSGPARLSPARLSPTPVLLGAEVGG